MILKCDYNVVTPSFETVLETTCERLWERRVQYSIRRIQEMGEILDDIERELEQLCK